MIGLIIIAALIILFGVPDFDPKKPITPARALMFLPKYQKFIIKVIVCVWQKTIKHMMINKKFVKLMLKK